MASLFIVLVLLVVVVAAGATVAAGIAIAHVRGRQVATALALPDEARRSTTVWRVVGVAVGLGAAAATTATGTLGRGALLAAPAFGLCVLAGVLTGELAVTSPAGPTRRAALETRRIRDYLPARLTGAVTGATALLAAVLAATTTFASPDDLGRPGRSIARACSPALLERHGPWAGSFYTVPLALALIIGAVATILALRRIAARPRPGDPRAVTGGDDSLRRRAARATIGAYGVLVTLPLIGVSLVTATALLSFSCRPVSWSVAGWSLLALVPLGLALLGWNVLAILVPRTFVTAPEPVR